MELHSKTGAPVVLTDEVTVPVGNWVPVTPAEYVGELKTAIDQAWLAGQIAVYDPPPAFGGGGAVPTLAQVLAAGNSAGGNEMFVDEITPDVGLVINFGGDVDLQGSDLLNPGNLALRTASAFLSNANILALPTTRFQVIPAPAAEEVTVPLGAVLRFHHGGGIIVNFDPNCILGLQHGDTLYSLGGQAMGLYESEGGVSGFLGAGPGESQIVTLGTSASLIGSPTPSETGIGIEQQLPVNFAKGKPLKLMAYNGVAGNFTGGSAFNNLIVIVLYVVVPA